MPAQVTACYILAVSAGCMRTRDILIREHISQGLDSPLLLEHPSEDMLRRGAGKKQHLKPIASHFSPGVPRQVLGIGHIGVWGAGAGWSRAWLVFWMESELLVGTWEVGLGLSGGI